MVPAVVHAALVTIIYWLLSLAAAYLGINVSESTVNEVAVLLVGYILSLAGLAAFNSARGRSFVIHTEEYHPPFT